VDLSRKSADIPEFSIAGLSIFSKGEGILSKIEKLVHPKIASFAYLLTCTGRLSDFWHILREVLTKLRE
jgi:hypothetical protein